MFAMRTSSPGDRWWGRHRLRRALLLSIALASGPVSAAKERAPRQLTPAQAAQHVLTRLAYGPRPRQLNEVARVGWKTWVERQLDPQAVDDTSLRQRIEQRCPSLAMDLTQLQQLDRKDVKATNKRQIKDELRTAVLLRAVYSQRQLQEVIVDFWRNHFNVDVRKVPFLATHYEEHVLRKHAFGKFSDLLLATARHPAMLVYLDNYVSNRRGLNENYARELMELHTLGVDNGYTQDDVVALARVLTGWTCGWRDGEYRFYFNDRAHDPMPVTILDEEFAAGGVSDGERALLLLSQHPNTARFIATKLCRYLVNDNPPDELIDHAAETFRGTDGDLRAVYQAIIFSPQFTSADNYRVKVKTPLEFMVSVLRAVSAQIDSPRVVLRQLELMGQPIYECLEPTGYSDQREAWHDPGVMIYRWNFAIRLVNNRVEGVTGGEQFVEPILDSPVDKRSREVMKLLLPGIKDRQLENLMASTVDPRALTACVLGSPAFQQQ